MCVLEAEAETQDGTLEDALGSIRRKLLADAPAQDR